MKKLTTTMTNIKYEPIGYAILLEAENISTTLQLPDSIRPEKYTIVAKSQSDKIPKELEVGDEVILHADAPLFNIKTTNYYVSNVDNILVKIKK